MGQGMLWGVIGVATFLETLGCDSNFGVAEQPPATTTSVASIGMTVLRPSEDPLVALSLQVPSFGGYYCSNGDLQLVVDEEATSDAQANLQQLVQSSNVASSCYNRDIGDIRPQIRVVREKYSFAKLHSWRDTLDDDYFEMPGAQGLGIDYQLNRIELEVKAGSGSTDAAAALASAAGVPDDGFIVVERDSRLKTPCPVPSDGYDVGSCFRPVPGGVAMTPTPNGGGSPITGQGTITASGARWNSSSSIWEDGYLTCAHCAWPPLLNSNDWIAQPDVPSGAPTSRVIGVETVDPAGWTCGSYQCRYSDSAWISDTSGNIETGQIVQTLYWNGNRIRSTTNPRFYIGGSRSSVQGMQVEKVGNASGWTVGTVQNVCVDYLDGLGHKYICNDRSDNYSIAGDSGSPVFFWYWMDGVNTVDIMGVLWGGAEGNDSRYSPFQNIANDLGGLYFIGI
jgi:hypothetical protein